MPSLDSRLEQRVGATTAISQPERRAASPVLFPAFNFVMGSPSLTNAALATAQFGPNGSIIASTSASTSFPVSFASTRRRIENVEHAVRTDTVTSGPDGVRFADSASATPTTPLGNPRKVLRGRPRASPRVPFSGIPRHTRASSTRSLDAPARRQSPARGGKATKTASSRGEGRGTNSTANVDDPPSDSAAASVPNDIHLQVATVAPAQQGNVSDGDGATHVGMSSADSDEHTGTEFGSLAGVLDEESNGDDTPAATDDDEDGSDVDRQVFATVHHTLPIRAPTRDADAASRALLPSSVANGHIDSFTVDVNLQRRDRSRSRTHRYLQEPDASSLQSQPSTALQAAAAKVTTRANLRADNAMPDFTPQPIPPFVALPTRSA